MPYGFFVALNNSKLSALCNAGEISDTFVKVSVAWVVFKWHGMNGEVLIDYMECNYLMK